MRKPHLKTTFITTLFALGAFTVLLFSNFKQADNFQNAILTGWDLRMCPRCGGLMMTFTNNDTPYHAPFLQVDSFPSNAGLTGKTRFPKYVKVKWHSETQRPFVVIDEMIFR